MTREVALVTKTNETFTECAANVTSPGLQCNGATLPAAALPPAEADAIATCSAITVVKCAMNSSDLIGQSCENDGGFSPCGGGEYCGVGYESTRFARCLLDGALLEDYFDQHFAIVGDNSNATSPLHDWYLSAMPKHLHMCWGSELRR